MIFVKKKKKSLTPNPGLKLCTVTVGRTPSPENGQVASAERFPPAGAAGLGAALPAVPSGCRPCPPFPAPRGVPIPLSRLPGAAGKAGERSWPGGGPRGSFAASETFEALAGDLSWEGRGGGPALGPAGAWPRAAGTPGWPGGGGAAPGRLRRKLRPAPL